MNFKTSPYLLITNGAENAIEFYKNTLDAQVLNLQRVEDRPDYAKKDVDQEDYQKIDHAVLSLGDIIVMIADDTEGLPITKGNNISLCLTFENSDETEQIYQKMINQGCEILVAYGEVFHTEGYAYVKDPFGVAFHLFTENK